MLTKFLKDYFSRLTYKDYLVFFTLLFFGAIYMVQTTLNHLYFRSFAFDYGFHIQAMWNISQFQAPDNTIVEGIPSFFSVHPTFTLVFITPIYWVLHPLFGSHTLNIIQNLFIILGGYGTYRFVLLKTDSFWLAFLSLVHFNVIWGHYSAISFEYIDATVASSFVPIFFFLFYKDYKVWALLSFIFIITSRENMPIWFMFISVFLIIDNLKERKRLKYAFVLLGLSIIYLIIINKILIPYFEDDTNHYWGFAYSAIGHNIPEAIIFVFSHPLEAIKLLFVNHSGEVVYDGIKEEFWIVFLLSGGAFLIMKPKYILLFLPIIAQKMFNDAYIRWGINIFYSIEVVSVLSISAFICISTIKKYHIATALSILLVLVTLQTTIVKMDHRTSKWYKRSKENIYDPAFYKTKFDRKKILSGIKKYIPDEAKVCGSSNIVPQIADRPYIKVFPYVGEADYIVLLDGETYPITKEEFEGLKSDYMNSTHWETLINDPPFYILRKKNNALPIKQN